MIAKTQKDWNPETYARFRGLRLRPALDLLARVGDIPDGPVIDLGCGNGAVGAALKERFGARLTGVDSSPAMLAEAQATGAYSDLEQADIAQWQPQTPPGLIFSNAALHWLPAHETLFPRFAGFLAKGGTLAVQMPRQFWAPSHRFLRDIAQSMFPDTFDFTGWEAPVHAATEYWRLLAPLGQIDVWETEYVQRLEPGEYGHPVRRFTESTALRPFVEKLTEDEATAFVQRYESALSSAYPLLPDGSALLPFRRLFLVLKV